MDFERVVRKRRMVRNFQRKAVSGEIVDRILELALHAPSAGFSQGWSYIVVTSEQLKKQIGKLQGEDDFYARKRPHHFISEAPVLIVACTSEKLYHDRYREPDKVKDDGSEIDWPTPYWYFDIGCGCMLIFLAVVNEGLASVFTGVFRVTEMRKLLGIPDHFHPVGVISIGHQAPDVKSPSLKRGRRPPSQVIHYEHW
ncbi:MAG TPA: nitroreductase family protein [Candidatus Acidoferrales bacterium]|nr:nitroreductase family protein [Candidatus Acidoferrales bacterium]